MCTNFWINPHNGKLPSRLAPAQCQNSLAPQLLSNINQSKSSLLIWHYVSYLFLLLFRFSGVDCEDNHAHLDTTTLMKMHSLEIIGKSETYWSNRAYTSEEGWCMVQRTLTDQTEHTLLRRVGVWYRWHLMIWQSIHFRRALVHGIENTYWSKRAYTSDESWCMVQRTLTDQIERTLLTRFDVWYRGYFLIKQSIHFWRVLVYGTDDTNWSNRAYTSDEGWCMVQRTLIDQTEHTLLTRFDVWYREHLLIKQSIHFRRYLMYGTENTYWSNRAYTSDEIWCMVQRTLTDQTEHTLPTIFDVWYREHLLIKQSIHFWRDLMYGTENTYWSNRAYTPDEIWCMVQRTLIDQTEHILLTRFDVWYREHLLIKQSVHFWQGLVYGTENTYWSSRACSSDEGWCMVQRTLTEQTIHTLLTKVGVWYREQFLIKQSIHFWRGLMYGTEDTNWSNRAYISDEGWCMVQRTLTDQTEHTLLTSVGVWYREHLLTKQNIHFRRGLVYGTEDTNWSNRAYTSDKGWCMVQRTLTDQTEHTLLTSIDVW